MNKLTVLLVSATALSVAVPAFAADKTSYESKTSVERDAKGNYDAETKTERTNAAGTKTTKKESVETDVSSKGDVDNTVKTETTTDPKGLLNKRTTKTTNTQDVKHTGEVKSSHKKVVDGKTVEDSTDTSK